ncbi:MAG: leucine-rich repeat protein, partial [Muribaculaceae bacterium]|nr:leucine-rich repeat protein [Muribaculaceae bacterium]
INYTGSLFPSNLKTAYIGENVKTISSSIFSGCKELTSIDIPNSVISISDKAFYDCSGLKTLNIGNSVISIGDKAFYDCSSLETIIIPNSVKSLGNDVFDRCNNLKKTAYPNTIECPFISSSCNVAYNPENVIIEDGWIYNKNRSSILFAPYNLSGEYIISETVNSIGNSAFLDCANLVSVVFGNSVKKIGERAFRGCVGLTSLNTPDSITSIGSYAFGGCNGLHSVRIGRGVRSIGAGAFSGCDNIEDFNFEAENCTYKFDYLGGLFPSNTKNVSFGENVKTIPPYSFYRCDQLTSFEIPSSVITIGDHAFEHCSNLKSVDMGNSVTTLGENAFLECTGLTNIKISNSLSEIKDSAFEDCFGLKEVILPPSVKILGYNVFNNCTSLKNIVMGNISKINSGAFYYVNPTTIYITSPNPPKTTNAFNIFSGVKLYVQGEESVNNYLNSTSGWQKFDKAEVMSEPKFINLNKDNICGEPGDKFTFEATLEPSDVSLPYIFWRSTNPDIAYVDHNGVVTIKHTESDERSCKIIAETLYYDGPVAEITVRSLQYSENVKNPNSIVWTQEFRGIKVGDEVELTAEATSGLSVKYVSSNEDIADIKSNIVKFKSVGEVEITAMQAGNDIYDKAESVTKRITVLPILTEVITLNKTELAMEIGDTYQLEASVSPDNVTNKNLVFETSNSDVVTISESGLVTAVGIGSATIIAKATDDSGVSATCDITVSGYSGVEKSDINSACNIYVKNGTLYITGVSVNERIEVYSFNGVCIYSNTKHIVPLPSGTYIVKVCNSIKKVIV